MQDSEIIQYLFHSGLPYQYNLPDTQEEPEYLGAVRLLGGAYLPCVTFRDKREYFRKTIPYLENLRKQYGIGSEPYQQQCELILLGLGNGIVHPYTISAIEKSIHAVPMDIYNQLDGPTGRNGMCFVAEMKDGKFTAYHDEILMGSFWEMPPGYSGEDIVNLWNHSYLTKEGKIALYGEGDDDCPDEQYLAYKSNHAVELRAVPYFVCYVEGLSQHFKSLTETER